MHFIAFDIGTDVQVTSASTPNAQLRHAGPDTNPTQQYDTDGNNLTHERIHAGCGCNASHSPPPRPLLVYENDRSQDNQPMVGEIERCYVEQPLPSPPKRHLQKRHAGRENHPENAGKQPSGHMLRGGPTLGRHRRDAIKEEQKSRKAEQNYKAGRLRFVSS
ncbi:hypothetical protein P171DRAFT_207867 [Karstenula rhodostoma CBS 690.94]|uniref:Uncharacterized protein n=1 Tax=Karstenula rhodostoma CBS 690.94 TaxID=1392251 RepID=A0A9P4UF64_9PLEO|nr:hypothetical protein P171DRAFT_207867 [Karstenula rhodostoma CBS 690.94]